MKTLAVTLRGQTVQFVNCGRIPQQAKTKMNCIARNRDEKTVLLKIAIKKELCGIRIKFYKSATVFGTHKQIIKNLHSQCNFKWSPQLQVEPARCKRNSQAVKGTRQLYVESLLI